MSGGGASAEPPLLIAGGYSAEVRFLDAARGDVVHAITLKDFGHVNRISVAPGAKQVVIAGNPHLHTFEARGAPSADPVCCYEGHKGNVTATGFDVSGSWMYSGSEDGTIKVWDCRTQQSQMSFDSPGLFASTPVHSVDLHPNQVELVAGDDQGRVHVWDLVSGRVRRMMTPEENVPVRSVCVAPDGRTLVCANHEGTCYVYQTADEPSEPYQPLQKVDAHGSYILRCAFSPEAKHMATVSADCAATLWRHQAEGIARCCTLSGHSRWVWDCAFSGDGEYLATGSSDCSCRLWDVRSGSSRLEHTSFEKAVTAVALVDALERR